MHPTHTAVNNFSQLHPEHTHLPHTETNCAHDGGVGSTEKDDERTDVGSDNRIMHAAQPAQNPLAGAPVTAEGASEAPDGKYKSKELPDTSKVSKAALSSCPTEGIMVDKKGEKYDLSDPFDRFHWLLIESERDPAVAAQNAAAGTAGTLGYPPMGGHLPVAFPGVIGGVATGGMRPGYVSTGSVPRSGQQNTQTVHSRDLQQYVHEPHASWGQDGTEFSPGCVEQKDAIIHVQVCLLSFVNDGTAELFCVCFSGKRGDCR